MMRDTIASGVAPLFHEFVKRCRVGGAVREREADVDGINLEEPLPFLGAAFDLVMYHDVDRQASVLLARRGSRFRRPHAEAYCAG